MYIDGFGQVVRIPDVGPGANLKPQAESPWPHAVTESSQCQPVARRSPWHGHSGIGLGSSDHWHRGTVEPELKSHCTGRHCWITPGP